MSWGLVIAMAAKLQAAEFSFEGESYIPVALEDGTVVGGNSPDLVVEETVIFKTAGAFPRGGLL